MRFEFLKPGARKRLLVVEVTPGLVKLAQYECMRRGARLSGLHVEPTDVPGDRLVAAIRDAVQEKRFAVDHVVLCLARQMVNVRVIELPSTDPEEIGDMIGLQIGRQTPYSTDEIISHYRIVGSTREGYTRVMLTIARRDLVRQHFLLLQEAGLAVQRVTIGTEGILGWASDLSQKASAAGETLAILDVDAGQTDLTVLREGSLLFSRSMKVRGDAILDGADTKGDPLFVELRKTMDMFQSDAPGVSIDRIAVTGAMAAASLVDGLGATLGIPVTFAPSLNTESGSDVKVDRLMSLTAVTGVAAYPDRAGLDLTPESAKLKRSLTQKADVFAGLAVLIVAALVGVSMYVATKAILMHRRLDVAMTELATASEHAARVEQTEALVRAVRSRQESGASAIGVLAGLHPLVPTNVVFENLQFDLAEARVVMTGIGPARQDVSELVQNLEGATAFANAEVEGPVRRDNQTGQYRFTVKTVLEGTP